MASDKDFRQGLLRLVDHPEIVNGLRVRDPKLVNFGQGIVYASPATQEFAVKFPIETYSRSYPADAFLTGALSMQLTDTDRLRAAIERIGAEKKAAPATTAGEVYIPRRSERQAAATRAAATPSAATGAVIPERPIAGVAAPERRSTQVVSIRSEEIRSDRPQFAAYGRAETAVSPQDVLKDLIRRRDERKALSGSEFQMALLQYLQNTPKPLAKGEKKKKPGAKPVMMFGDAQATREAMEFFGKPSNDPGDRWKHLTPLFDALINKVREDIAADEAARAFKERQRAALQASAPAPKKKAETTFGELPEDASIETIAAAMRPNKRVLAFTYATRKLGLVLDLKPIPQENQRAFINEIVAFDTEQRQIFERELAEYREKKALRDDPEKAARARAQRARLAAQSPPAMRILFEEEETDPDEKLVFPTPPTSILIAEVSDGSRRVVDLQTGRFEDPRRRPTEWASARLAAILDKVPKIRPLPGSERASEAYELRRSLEAAGERFAGPGGRMYESKWLTEQLSSDPEMAATYRYRGGKSAIQIRTEMAKRMGVGEGMDSAAERLERLGVPVTDSEVKAAVQTMRLLLGEEVTERLEGTAGALPGGARLKKGEEPTGVILVGEDGYSYIAGTTKKYPEISQARTFLKIHGHPEPRIYYAKDLLEEDEEFESDEPRESQMIAESEEEVIIPRRAQRMRASAPASTESVLVEEEEGEVTLPRKPRSNPTGWRGYRR